MNVITLDTETTGLLENDYICQLAFIVNHESSSELFENYCKPPTPVSFGAMSINHITNEELENELQLKETKVFKKLNLLNSASAFLVIHNAQFDLKMLKKDGFEWYGYIIDTLQCARHIFPELKSHSLQYLRYALGLYKKEKAIAKEFNIEIFAHDARADAVVLKLLLDIMLEKYTLNDLVNLSQLPVKIERIGFGKYRGLTIKQIATTDRGYLFWVLENIKELDINLQFSIESELNIVEEEPIYPDY